ncbi:mitochondrial resolvase Ydc2 [Diplogelasinospora grovesii]|uniref:Mitochondrial resolvase Ydc2 n=1 Tax=Diplogelasinospora grovesii TaxID=303347 RepID=A0AAN6N9R1_9PEZI|nr:mitochondrial resolvase Ydc2 [Diplogelasinospora grovesii]
MKLSIPTKASLTQLRDLAVKCGLNKTGTRVLLSQGLQDAVTHCKPLPSTARILSIDMGIRNLAFSLLTPEAPSRTSPSHTITPQVPVVHAWKRLSLSSTSSPTSNSLSDSGLGGVEDFTPSSMCRMAVALVQNHMLPLEPTHILIERQRFRSGGNPAVFEWTVRVNTLEAMLYAIFGTLRSLGKLNANIIPIPPKRVGSFLLSDEDPGDSISVSVVKPDPRKAKTRQKTAATVIKKAKINLLGTWLQDGNVVKLGNAEVKGTAEAFLTKWNRTTHRGLLQDKTTKRKKKSDEGSEDEPGETLVKLDDLSDCLLQGLAWLRWQQNVEILSRGLLPEDKP